MASGNLTLAINRRKHLRRRITQIHNEYDTFRSFSERDRVTKLSILRGLSEDLKNFDLDIQNLKFSDVFDENEFEQELIRCDEYSTKIHECISALESLKSNSSTHITKHLLKSPVAPLPTFSGKDDENFSKFLKSFEETISRYDYPDHDKFLLLKQQLSQRALVLVDSLESDKQTYDSAKTLLKSAFASTPVQIFNTIKQISQIKLLSNQDPFEYISKMRKLTESVNLLKIDSNQFLQYFFWVGLNDSFKEQVIQITNNTHPTLEELNDNFFTAAERYAKFQEKVKNQNKQQSGKDKNLSKANLAVSIDRNSKAFNSCVLCSQDKAESNHPIYRCPTYTDPPSKINKLNEMAGCIKCGKINHVSDDCKFKFQRRCSCGSWHFCFLCPKFRSDDNVSNSKKAKGKQSESVSNSNKTLNVNSNRTVVIDSFQNSSHGDSVLPTFSCNLNNRYHIRGLKDEGSQCNFILSAIAEELDLKVIHNNIKLKVNGFNGPREYQTKTVKLNIDFGDKCREIEAICVPEININIRLHKLMEVTKLFVNKGYSLADKKLLECSESISEVDFVLGSNSAYCLKSNEVSFGPNHTSVYANTSLGVMLLGKVSDLLRDLPHLPDNATSLKDFVSVENKEIKSESSENIDLTTEELNYESSVNFVVLDDSGKVNRSELELATGEILNSSFYTPDSTDDFSSELNKDLIKFSIDNTSRTNDGRLIMPLLWRTDVAHLLGRNYNLAKAILDSNFKKLIKKPSYMSLMDESFREQIKLGILEPIPDLQNFMQENPGYSFLPHMGVFRLKRETTKCRVVYLSNLCGNDSGLPLTVSHNQAMHSGPSLNQKLSSAILNLRFDSKLLIFDLSKAFNMIQLSMEDSTKLLCLWYRNVSKQDYTVVGYMNRRLPFGLRCSPTLLMLGLYKILITDAEDDCQFRKNLKKLIYQCIYMDNGAFTTNDEVTLSESYDQLNSIFNPYKFEIQQVVTNDINVQAKIDREAEPPSDQIKLLGLFWNRSRDTFSTSPIDLNKKANTKRSILKSIAEQYDIHNFNAPLLNRARLFMHELQCDKHLTWDNPLDRKLQNEWKNIVNQANSSSLIEIPRMMGKRTDKFRLIACTDASTKIYGVVVYAHNLNSNELTFVLSKNRIISGQLESKTVPALELQAIALGAETLIDVYKGLSGPECTVPIDIVDLVIYSDSLVALSWMYAFSNKFEKMQKRTVFVMNRVKEICHLCDTHPIVFKFIAGVENPADLTTRCISSKQLKKSNYVSGPSFVLDDICFENSDSMSFIVPNPVTKIQTQETSFLTVSNTDLLNQEPLVDPEEFSSFAKMANIHFYVLKYIHNLKRKVNPKLPEIDKKELHDRAIIHIISNLQHTNFPEIYTYFENKTKRLKDIPNVVRQLNVYVDKNGLLRVKSKFGRWQDGRPYTFPLLLPKKSHVTDLIILELHKQFKHAGCYTILSELRKRFWVPHCFSVVKKALKKCITCKRFNAKPIKCNQNSYREFRVDPPSIPYNYIYMDYIGPFEVKDSKSKFKVWILGLTCMWSRSVNLKLCYDFSSKEFLRAFQLHILEWGLPQLCISDLGSQLVSGTKIIQDFLKDVDTQKYFTDHGVKYVRFENYVKGKSELGSLIESCVKQVKKLIFASVGKTILPIRDFEFLMHEVIHIVNRRPIAFKESLRNVIDDIASPITPEMLTKGYELQSLNVIPDLHPIEPDPDWSLHSPQNIIRDNYEKLRKVRQILRGKYQDEFLANLIFQATDKQNRYVPKPHKHLDVGDIVLIKEPNCKPYNFPLGIIKSLETNSIGENTSAVVFKGKTRELTKRHVSSLIPLLSQGNISEDDKPLMFDNEFSDKTIRVKRQAAQEANEKNTLLFSHDLA